MCVRVQTSLFSGQCAGMSNVKLLLSRVEWLVKIFVFFDDDVIYPSLHLHSRVTCGRAVAGAQYVCASSDYEAVFDAAPRVSCERLSAASATSARAPLYIVFIISGLMSPEVMRR